MYSLVYFKEEKIARPTTGAKTRNISHMTILQVVESCSKNAQNCFAYISAIKYRSEAVLYSKQMAGYPLSPHIKTIDVAFLQAE